MEKINKKYLIFGIVMLLIIGVVGVTYAYWVAQIEGEGAPMTFKSANLKVVFTDDAVLTANLIEPGWSDSKTFSIKNESDETYTYNILIKDLVNTFVTEGYLQYKITSSNGYNMTEYKDIPKSDSATDQVLVYSTTIPGGVTQNYTIEFIYRETEEDQSDDMGKQLSGTLAIQEGTTDLSDTNLLFNRILADHTTRLTRTDFSTVFTDENTNTLYTTTKTENGNTSYYFAGNALDNWVYFADNYWRIIRINEDNSVRLLYVGADKDTTAGYIGTSAYNSEYDKPRYVGYMYGDSSTDSLENDRENNTNSTIKEVIDSWYSSNITAKNDGSNSYDKYVSRTAIYCNDRSIGDGTYSTSVSFIFGASIRLQYNKAPSYKCGQNTSTGLFESSQASADKFSGSTSGGGNGKLTYPVALMLADEVAFAGGVYGTNAEAWYYYNAAGGSVVETSRWWTMSPYTCASGDHASVFYVYGPSKPGSLVWNTVHNTSGVRPVLSLKSCVFASGGDGTSDNPYKVSIGGSCTTALN